MAFSSSKKQRLSWDAPVKAYSAQLSSPPFRKSSSRAQLISFSKSYCDL